MRDTLEIIKKMGVPVREIRLSGGGARGELWQQIQADAYGQKVSLINASEGPRTVSLCSRRREPGRTRTSSKPARRRFAS